MMSATLCMTRHQAALGDRKPCLDQKERHLGANHFAAAPAGAECGVAFHQLRDGVNAAAVGVFVVDASVRRRLRRASAGEAQSGRSAAWH